MAVLVEVSLRSRVEGILLTGRNDLKKKDRKRFVFIRRRQNQHGVNIVRLEKL